MIWISYERFATALKADGKLHSSPELLIEVLSPGSENERRDREVKLKLYSRRGVEEYWLVNWALRLRDILNSPSRFSLQFIKPQKALEKSKIREVFFFSACYNDQVTSMRTLVRWCFSTSMNA